MRWARTERSSRVALVMALALAPVAASHIANVCAAEPPQGGGEETSPSHDACTFFGREGGASAPGHESCVVVGVRRARCHQTQNQPKTCKR